MGNVEEFIEKCINNSNAMWTSGIIWVKSHYLETDYSLPRDISETFTN